MLTLYLCALDAFVSRGGPAARESLLLLSELEDELGVALVGPHGRPTPAAVGLAEAVRTALRSIDDFFPAADRSRGESLPANVLPFSCPSAAHVPGSRATELRGPVEGRTAGHRCTARGGA